MTTPKTAASPLPSKVEAGLIAGTKGNNLALSDLRGVARHLVDHFAANTACGTLPGELLHGDVTEVTVKCLGLAVRMLESGNTPSEKDLANVHDAAARWAREGVPLRAILRAYHDGFRYGLTLVGRQTAGQKVEDVTADSLVLVTLLEAVTTEVSMAYVDEYRSVASEHHTATHTLVTTLLSGGKNATATAQQCGIDLADDYLVLALHFPQHPDEANPVVDRTVSARRKLRRIQAELATSCGKSPLALLSTEGGTILLPAPRDREWVDALIERLSRAGEVPVTGAVTSSDRDDIPAAAEHVYELLSLARQLGRPAGLYRTEDLVLEYQLTRPGRGREQLLRALEPLDDAPELLETLTSYLGHELNRQRTARHLFVHANTVDYRLKRIGQLTGIDPSIPSGLRYLQAAIVARGLENAKNAQSAAAAAAKTTRKR
ncbi:PucR family transcriptional regulator [Rhodococcoides corynebacterioides]|uniref:PucR family transcriptional regulator n=1 Tax=Rhodococcoides corynebacterioides TaxID=53972 RepID=UPI001C9AA19D|nr:helix-turn-helix domain-containing protein [Rhodococcus corynebacterioides]MBY6351469.1 helix-turn-helix domain-containing protein [Rhodococcus corynebacterioides]MBY6364031.1 helix-turn-helix domain-containing protein [Rhodococcus corynebacterioides]